METTFDTERGQISWDNDVDVINVYRFSDLTSLHAYCTLHVYSEVDSIVNVKNFCTFEKLQD